MSQKHKSQPLKHGLIRLFIAVVAALPFSFAQNIGAVFGRLVYWLNGRSVKVAAKNIALCLPELSDTEQRTLLRQSCIHSGMLAFESPWIWSATNQQVADLIESVENESLLKTALAKGKGVILTGPHLGNWEALLNWGGVNLPAAVVYRMPKIEEMDDFLRSAREKSGVELILGERAGVRGMLSKLKKGEVFMVLSDQNPAAGSGVFAPFFHRPAYTMTLLHRLVEKTGAELLTFFALRTENGFRIMIGKPDFDITTQDPTEFATGLNRALSRQIRLAPEQFEWTYRRYRPQVDDGPPVYENL